MQRVVHFEIGADKPDRAVKFYEQVFGWKIEKWNGPQDYWVVSTGDEKEVGINGGIMKRSKPTDTTVNTVDVPSVDDYTSKITASGGKVLMPKMAVPGVGFMAYCQDTEGNVFGIMQMDKNAK